MGILAFLWFMSENTIENELNKGWNSGPIHLSKQNMCLPRQVLQDFFNLYSLPEIRSLLKFIFHFAPTENNLSKEQLSLLQNQLTKLIEAAWLLNTNGEQHK
jgi:hypothetical protein